MIGGPRAVVVGAGVAGLIAARSLSQTCDVVVVDKGRGVGGRLATRRIGDATFDHGAQFITTHTTEFAGLAADAVILTAPVPQTLALLAAGGAVLTEADAQALQAIDYEPCLAVMAVLDGAALSGLAASQAIASLLGLVEPTTTVNDR